MLDLVVDSKDGLAEDIAAEYEPGTDALEGKFILQTKAAGGLAVEDVAGLKKSLEASRGEVNVAQKKLKTFDGISDPKAAKDAMKKVAEMAGWDPDKEVSEKIAAREAELIKVHTEALTKETSRGDGLASQLEKTLVIAAATEAIQKAGGRIQLLLPHVRNQVRMKQSEGGDFIAEVFDPVNKSPRVGDTQGNPMTIPALVAEMKASDDFAAAFDGTGSTGGGAGGGGAGNAESGKKGGSGGDAPTKKTGKVPTVSRSDQTAMNDNWEKIAKGEVEVVD